MPSFQYIAKDASGKECVGVVQADSEAAVTRSLAQRSLFPVRITAQSATPRGAAAALSFGSRVRLRDLGAAYSQLADLLRAGVPMLRSLEILARSAANPQLGRLLSEVKEDVSAGEALADALAKHPKVFIDLHAAMVRAGETGGFLEDVLANLANFIERQDDLRGKVRGAMIYPCVLASLSVVAVLVVLLKFVPMFKGYLDVKNLPMVSQVLFAISDALRFNAHWVLLAAVAVVAPVLFWLRGQAGRRTWNHWKLRIPVIGKAIRMVAITRFCRVFGTLLKNGIPIIHALQVSKDATGNAVMSEAIDQAAENVRGGEPLAEPLQRSGLFPPEIVEMIAVGEESNQLEKVLLETADVVERRTSRQVDAAVRLVEPLLLMFMAGAIGFIALGLLYPIFSMAQTMR